MIDLHTHILPGMDDGAPDAETALRMLAAEAEQGVRAVALTPHFHRDREHVSDFLARRREAMARLRNALGEREHPHLIPGAETAWVPGMAEWQELEQLCYENTRILLVELPMTPWHDDMFRQLYAIEGRRGITPMIAHAERYIGTQTGAHFAKLLETGFPLQVSTAPLRRWFGRRRVLELLTAFHGVLSTDCHNMTTRPPDMGAAAQVLEKKLGKEGRAILRRAEQFILQQSYI